jgi:hypothetical protein
MNKLTIIVAGIAALLAIPDIKARLSTAEA